jgi:hypothetical protein
VSPQVHLSLSRAAGASTDVEVLLTSLAISRHADAFARARELCDEADADNSGFLLSAPGASSPPSFCRKGGFFIRFAGLLDKISAKDMASAGIAAAEFDGPGRTDVPTPVSQFSGYVNRLKSKDAKKMLLGPIVPHFKGVAKPRLHDLFRRVVPFFLANHAAVSACFVAARMSWERGAAPPPKTKVQLLEQIKQMESASAEKSLLMRHIEREGERAVAALNSANARAQKLRVR